MAQQYQEAVAEARRLVKRSEEDQWRLAQLTWEQVEAGSSRGQWARDIEVDRAHVRRLYNIWAQWGRDQVSTRPRFADAYAAEKRQGIDPFEGGNAQDVREQAKTAVRNMPAEQKAAVVREALEDREVADRVARDTATRANLSKATDKIDRERQEAARESYELRNPRSHQIGAIADLEYALTKARRDFEDAREAAETLAGNWPDEDTRERALVLGQRAQAAGELFMAAVRGEDLDEELRRLVAQGDA